MSRRLGLAAALVIGAAVFSSVGAPGAPRCAVADGPGTPEYLGAARCKKCHLKQWKSWKDTKMAKALETLKPGQAKEAKAKAGLDPAKDYTKEARCLACHTTGYGEPGGYPKLGDAAGEARAAERAGLQCETCHGPGSKYTPYKTEHEKDYKRDEAVKLGLVVPDEKGCLKCHRGGPDGSPTMKADEKFDAAAKMKEDGSVHVHPKK